MTLYEGVLLGSKSGRDRVVISCHMLGGIGELNLFLGNEEIGLWNLSKDSDHVNLSQCKIEDFFNTFGCHEAQVLARELECDANTMLELCRVARENGIEKTWKMHIEPLIKWQGIDAVKNVLMLYVCALIYMFTRM